MNQKIKNITLIALFAAFVLISSKIEIRITADSRVHFGNAICLLSSFILNPISAGLSAGIGSLFFDLIWYPSSLPFNFLITFINKFVMSFVCGLVFKSLKNTNKNEIAILIISGLAGEIAYIILYLLKTFIDRYFIAGITQLSVLIPIILIKAGSSVINAIFAIIVSVIIYKPIKKYLNFID